MRQWLEQILIFDARISKILRVPKEQKFLSIILKIFAHSGDSWFWLAGLFITWIFSEGEWRQRSAFLGVGLFIMAAVVILLKFSIRRPRPEGEWGQIYRITDPHSFPSGHAAIIREVHIYGQSLEVGEDRSGIAQHSGLGTQLIAEAEKIAKDAGYKRLPVLPRWQ